MSHDNSFCHPWIVLYLLLSWSWKKNRKGQRWMTARKLPYICWVFLQMSSSLRAFFHLCHFSVLFSAPSLTKTSFLSNHSFWKVIQNNGSHWRMCWNNLKKLNGVITFSAVAPWGSKPPCKISGIRELLCTMDRCSIVPPPGQRWHLDWDDGGA